MSVNRLVHVHREERDRHVLGRPHGAGVGGVVAVLTVGDVVLVVDAAVVVL
jgi:hypothetical protein